MSGSIGDWMGAQNTGNVLAGIANPKTPNILGMYGSVADVASRMWQNREMQAKQLAGQAQQQGIDANGVYQPNVAGQALSAAGPAAALAVGPTLESSQRLSDAQLAQARAKLGWVNAASGAVLQQGDYSDQAMMRLFQTGMANGMLTLPEVQKQLALLPPDPAGRARWLQEHQMTSASTQQQLDQTYGTTGTQTGPGGRTIGFRQAPASRGAGISTVPQPGAPQGMSAEDANQIVQVPYPKLLPNGQPNPQFGSTFPMRKGDLLPLLPGTAEVQGGSGGGLPPSLRNPAKAAPDASSPPPPGAPPPAPAAATTPYTGGGIGAVLRASPAPAAAPPPAAVVAPPPASVVAPPPASVVPPRPAPAAAPPPPPANAPTPSSLVPVSSLQGGVPVASTNALAPPNVGPPGAPNPLVPGDVRAIAAGMAQARGAPATGPQTAAAGPAPFFGSTASAADIEMQRHQVDQAAEGFKTISDQAVASRPRSAILGNMLGDTSAFATGPLATRIEAVRAIANRFGIPVSTEGLSAAESFNKLAAQLANNQGAGTDARLNVNVAANPHAELSPAGVDLMIRQLQGNEDYLQARAKLAASYGDQTNIKQFEQEVGSKVDPRAFQFGRMTTPQRQAYYKGLSDADKAAVRSSYNWLNGQGLVP
jgi:hypothetical protein